jgi:septal ring-binding cell division protein DamX
LAGALLMLGLVALWQTLQPKPAIEIPLPPPVQAPAIMPPPLPPLQVAPVQEPARPEPPPIPEERKQSNTPLLDKHVESSQAWLESVASNRWFVQLFTSLGSDRPEQVEHFIVKVIDTGVDLGQLRVYHSEISGIGRYGVIYGDYASRREAVNALNALPPELKRHRPYPRQTIRLKPNSNTTRTD